MASVYIVTKSLFFYSCLMLLWLLHRLATKKDVGILCVGSWRARRYRLSWMGRGTCNVTYLLTYLTLHRRTSYRIIFRNNWRHMQTVLVQKFWSWTVMSRASQVGFYKVALLTYKIRTSHHYILGHSSVSLMCPVSKHFASVALTSVGSSR